MSIIVYDGHTLVIDNAAMKEGIKVPIIKAWTNEAGEVMTGIGNAAQIALMRDWYVDGADPLAFPASQRDGNPWCDFIIASKGGLKRYEKTPSAIDHGQHKCAFGLGHEIAIGAMAAGADAKKAAFIVTQFHPYCGHGINSYVWEEENAPYQTIN